MLVLNKQLRGVPRGVKSAIESLQYTSLPTIDGKWYWVDPHEGSSNGNGRDIDNAMDSIATAYAACTSGNGDGIILVGFNSTSTANCTSYLTSEITWSKHGITVVGLSAPTVMNQRSRISNDSTDGLDLPNLITVSGDNNTFINVHMANYGSDAAAIGGLEVSGNRNAFINCHVIGAGGATAAATHYSLKINGGQENTFYQCVFGTDTIDRGNNANCELLYDGTAYRNRFFNCEFLAATTTGTAHGAIKSADATSIGRDEKFQGCFFSCFIQNQGTAMASAFIGTAPTSGYFYMIDCYLGGYAAWDSVAGNDCVYVAAPAIASGAGGITTTV